YDDPIQIEIYAYFVLLSYIYDAYSITPYLKFLGDLGTAKTRALIVLGLIAYKSLFSSGINSEAALFRLMKTFRGTLIHDEADETKSNIESGTTKVLNTGNSPWFPVTRCDPHTNDPYPYRSFSCKFIGARKLFKDKATESRCYTRKMPKRTRKELKNHGIPIVLNPKAIMAEAQIIRNKCLLFRLRNLDKIEIQPNAEIDGVDPRLAEVMTPILNLVENDKVREALIKNAMEYQKKTDEDRAMSYEASILAAIDAILEDDTNYDADRTNKYINDDNNIVILIGDIIERMMKIESREKKPSTYTIGKMLKDLDVEVSRY
ncbi:MAG: hypothetical protein GTN76_08925, partial [Candidatus Aenigmarchaeota archaeon]|nr:hypothetical protein [Candidatus Aenigmarchaeota archaeon]